MNHFRKMFPERATVGEDGICRWSCETDMKKDRYSRDLIDITRSVLQKVQKDSIIIDLASKLGGTDFEAAHQLNVKAVHALALPGKTAPITSGKLIAEAIKNIYTERRETDVFTRH